VDLPVRQTKASIVGHKATQPLAGPRPLPHQLVTWLQQTSADEIGESYLEGRPCPWPWGGSALMWHLGLLEALKVKEPPTLDVFIQGQANNITGRLALGTAVRAQR